MTKLMYDYVIVGAGCVIANRLSWIKYVHHSPSAFLNVALNAVMPFNDGNQDGIVHILGNIHRERRKPSTKHV